MLSILTTLALVAAPQAVTPVGSLQRLAVPADPSGTLVLNVELDGIPSELVMDKYSVRAADFKVFATRPDGSIVEVPAPAPKTWRGTITGRADARVIASITNEGLSAIVVDELMDLEWQIQPAEGHPAGTYSVAKKSDLRDPIGTCGVPNSPSLDTQSSPPQSSALGTGLQLCEIALDADFEFFQRNGSSVSATIDDMERVMNRVDDIYVRDSDVTFQITGIVVRSTINDPYTSADASTLLGQFANHWNGNFAPVRRDLAHLFTGRNVNGGTIGVAFLSAVCNTNSNAYGLSESRFTNNLTNRTGLTAHEIGHNFAQSHCDGNGDCRIMCANLGGCNNDVTRFGTSRATGIRNYAVSRPCLLDLADPLVIPFTDDVPLSSVNTDIWISNQGVTASTAGVGEPSGTRSLQFNATNANLLSDDTLISNKMLLNGLTGVDVQFEVQARGVPTGGALRVDVLDAFGSWVQVVRLVSDGVTQTGFSLVIASLPANAYHDGAQIRIVAEVDSPSQTWYVDDFTVTDVSCGVVTTVCAGSPTSVTSGASLSTFGTTSIAANNFGLFTQGVPPGQFGLGIYGDAQDFVPLGDGLLCIGGTTIYRLGLAQADLFGIAALPVDFNNLPIGGTITPGETVFWQFWFRDTTPAGFNLTDAISVIFCP